MKNLQTFEDFLGERCPSELQTNNSPEGFERWLEGQDVNDIMEYADDYGGKCYKAGKVDAYNEANELAKTIN